MTRTIKEIIDAAERRWTRLGYNEKQKQARRKRGKFVINPEGKNNAYVNKEEPLRRRIELDHTMDELNEQRAQREVWDE